MKNNLTEIGEFIKPILKNKALIKLRKDINYVDINIIGKIAYDSNGAEIGRILDVIGNVEQPYALVNINYEISHLGKIFVSFKQRRRKR
ncbi:H/ACA RNA-protein complex protein Gar1 [Sulfolobus sp. A20]|uniref:H/ACA RNA-protein complex protein Gar1 n=1 Tax=Sulfolobaceae TaxID=118883 RepID=UPI0008460BBC|nr:MULTISPECIES: H/ACA RNA-protein complex protein Gar1 [unclassified Sulfolobus]TRM74369.1 H/ACA RNA-protein complex protein Gar1 [Sulfolobus sp. E5]TRM78170.1 H/ACA RNA-protein complex protein Gar1 [Sulfolobus sp. A20-N-F8]TRM79381.1 H/ACA RNA-protein complex protein Gar1 [Sulfolobus sp. B5]TRM84141.1 H/ACA RNA-protein complex protein Gar1 [Sulfolobus sp. A20-N-F6]TRM88833.1 H/ACA RNA-protein complex protein Gar1 [Sulfolobus sp. C3]TRM93263.1 H/ACA RNA-protein complex protein Gar1 [Sulfolob